MVLLARKDEEGNTQTLYDHLHGAGRLASGFRKSLILLLKRKAMKTSFDVQESLLQLKIKAAMN